VLQPQPFSTAIAQSFLVTTACEPAQSFYKITELGRGHAGAGGSVRATCGSVAGAQGAGRTWTGLVGRSGGWVQMINL
jgi:hypothetical protein